MRFLNLDGLLIPSTCDLQAKLTLTKLKVYSTVNERNSVKLQLFDGLKHMFVWLVFYARFVTHAKRDMGVMLRLTSIWHLCEVLFCIARDEVCGNC